MTKKYPVVIVEWEDAFVTGGIKPVEDGEANEPCVRHSVGFLVKRGPRLIIVQTETGAFSTIQDTLSIPKSLVRKLTRLKEDG